MRPDHFDSSLKDASVPEIMSALFTDLVVQHTNMALVFLGKIVNPETGFITTDLPTAKHFVDQLEMLEFKTNGNLTPAEGKLLREALDAVRSSLAESLDAQVRSVD